MKASSTTSATSSALPGAVLALAVMSLFTSSALAFGGQDSGGGGGIGSSPLAVSEMVSTAKLELAMVVSVAESDAKSIFSPTIVRDSRVKAVLEAMTKRDGAGLVGLSDILATEYKLGTGPCPSTTDDNHDASTAFSRNAEVCFSTSLLSRFPKWALQSEIVSLAAHEHAHHFGFNEDDANRFQKYVFNVYGFHRIQSKLRILYRELDNYRARVKTGYSPAGSPAAKAFAESICRDLSVIEGVAEALEIDRFIMDTHGRPSCTSDSFDPDKLEARLREIENLTISDFNNGIFA